MHRRKFEWVLLLLISAVGLAMILPHDGMAQPTLNCSAGGLPPNTSVLSQYSSWQEFTDSLALLVCNYQVGSEGGENTAGFAINVEYRCPAETAETWEGITFDHGDEEVSRGSNYLHLSKTGSYTSYAGQFPIRERYWWLLDSQTIVKIILFTNGSLGVTSLLDAGSALASANRPSARTCSSPQPPSQNNPPTVTLTMSPQEPTVDDVLQFKATASDPDNDTITYEWFLDGQQQNASGSSVQWSEPSEGQHTLDVVVSDGKGGTDKSSVTFTVETEESDNGSPEMSLSMSPEEPTVEDTITFTADAEDPDDDGLTYEWFLDGEQQNASVATVTWSEPTEGEHTITVQVSDGNGGTDEDSLSFTVAGDGCHPIGQEQESGWLDRFSLLRASRDRATGPLSFHNVVCHAPPQITGISIPGKIPVDGNAQAPWTVSYSNPGQHYNMTLTIEEPGALFGWNTVDSFGFDTGGAKQGTYSLFETCTEPGSYQFRATVNNLDGDSEPYFYSFECVGNTSASRPTLTKEEKAALKIAAENWGAFGDSVAFMALACAWAPEAIGTKACALIGGLIAGGSKLNGRRLSILARDPADPNFTDVAQPITPRFTPVAPGPDVPQVLATSVNDLLNSLAESIGLSEALLHALERAQGAFDAGNSHWQNEQMKAAARFAARLATLIGEQPTLVSELGSSFQAAGFPDFELSETDVRTFQQEIKSNGLPSDLVSAFRQFGADDTAVQEIGNDMANQSPRAVAGSLLAKLNDSKLRASASSARQAFNTLAASMNGSTPPPPPSGNTSIGQALDVNGNNLLDDAEARAAIQLWIFGQPVPGTNQTIDDATIGRLIKMWILGDPVSNSPAAAASLQGITASLFQLSAPGSLIRELRVQEQDITTTQLQLFDLSGRRVLEVHGAGPSLRFGLLSADGKPLANGVYLYAVTAMSSSGDVWRSGVRKLVVLR